MKFMIRTNYLIFPVYTHATNKKLTFQVGGETLLTLDLKLDHASPDFWAYTDVSCLKGEVVELSVTPEMDISFKEADEMDLENLYHECMRPQVHFTVKNGCLVAPMGLFVDDGTYYLVYRCNPAEAKPGNDCWGYAVSRDLIHWAEEKTVTFPQEIASMLTRQMRPGWEKLWSIRKQAQAERTELFSLTDGDGVRKWICMNPDGTYRVGTLCKGSFVAEQEEKTLCYGSAAYAILSEPESGNVLKIDFETWGAPYFHFCGQMSVPMELSLEKRGDAYVLRAFPISAIRKLYKNTNRYEAIRIAGGQGVDLPLADSAHLIHLKGDFDRKGTISAVLFGREMVLDLAENSLSISGRSIPVSLERTCVDLTILVDRCGMEIFADGGCIYTACLSEDTFVDRNLLSLTLHSDTEATFDLIEIHSLESIW